MKTVVELDEKDLVRFAKDNLDTLKKWAKVPENAFVSFKGVQNEPVAECPVEAFEKWFWGASNGDAVRGCEAKIPITKLIRELTGLNIVESKRIADRIEATLMKKDHAWKETVQVILGSPARRLITRLQNGCR